MNLHQYLSSPGAMSLTELCAAAGVKNTCQMRQWRYGYGGRRPGPAHCLAIERATGGKVTRAELRPHDAHVIWPDVPPPVGKRTAEKKRLAKQAA